MGNTEREGRDLSEYLKQENKPKDESDDLENTDFLEGIEL